MNSESSGIDYSAVLADLEAKRAQLDAAITGIRVMLALGGSSGNINGIAMSAVNAAAVATAELAPDTFFNLSIPDAARKYLAFRKRTATTPEIVDALKKGGQPNAASETFARTVGSVLHRVYGMGAGIVRVSRGTWGLAEWYPNKPRKPSNKATGQADENGDSE